MRIAAVSAGYLALAVAYLALFPHNADWTGAIVKTLPVLLLAASLPLLARGPWRSWIGVALLFSALGDLLLALDGMGKDLFLEGLGSFFVAQIAYAQLFWRERRGGQDALLVAGVYLLIVLALAAMVLPAAGALALPAGIYMTALTAMVCGAIVAGRSAMLVSGALCFAFSDSLIGIDRFLMPVPLGGFMIMASYYAAQWLIWRAALADKEPQTAPEARHG